MQFLWAHIFCWRRKIETPNLFHKVLFSQNFCYCILPFHPWSLESKSGVALKIEFYCRLFADFCCYFDCHYFISITELCSEFYWVETYFIFDEGCWEICLKLWVIYFCLLDWAFYWILYWGFYSCFASIAISSEVYLDSFSSGYIFI